MREHRPSLVPFFLLTAVMSLGYGSVYTLLAEIRDRFGFTDSQVGLIAFAGLGMGFVAQVFLARLADRGHAGAMVRLGVFCAAAGMVTKKRSLSGPASSSTTLFLPSADRRLASTHPALPAPMIT